jgi:hypothetical protein
MSTRLGAAVLDLSALAAVLGIVPLDPPAVDAPIAPDTALVNLADLLRTFHEHRPADVHRDLVLVGIAVAEWVPAARYLATLTELACARGDLSISDVAALGLARAARLPLVTGVASLAGADPEVAVLVLARRP